MNIRNAPGPTCSPPMKRGKCWSMCLANTQTAARTSGIKDGACIATCKQKTASQRYDRLRAHRERPAARKAIHLAAAENDSLCTNSVALEQQPLNPGLHGSCVVVHRSEERR